VTTLAGSTSIKTAKQHDKGAVLMIAGVMALVEK
jgi:hypothetical protein